MITLQILRNKDNFLRGVTAMALYISKLRCRSGQKYEELLDGPVCVWRLQKVLQPISWSTISTRFVWWWIVLNNYLHVHLSTGELCHYSSLKSTWRCESLTTNLRLGLSCHGFLMRFLRPSRCCHLLSDTGKRCVIGSVCMLIPRPNSDKYASSYDPLVWWLLEA